MTPDQFLDRCRSLRHVGPAGAWDHISTQGFRTAEQLILAADLDEVTREQLLTEPRREHVRLTIDGNQVTLRDQGPLFARKDWSSILGDGLTIADWVRMLNRRVYLFASTEPMKKMIDKYVALDGAQDVITLSPIRVLEAARGRIEMASRNSGAVARESGPQKRRSSFVSMWESPDRTPTEVTIVDGLEDLAVVVYAERHHADGRREVLKA